MYKIRCNRRGEEAPHRCVGTPSNECFDLILGKLDWTIEVLFAQIIFPPDVTDSDYISQIYIIVYSQLL